jgi:hypothetical protein
MKAQMLWDSDILTLIVARPVAESITRSKAAVLASGESDRVEAKRFKSVISK